MQKLFKVNSEVVLSFRMPFFSITIFLELLSHIEGKEMGEEKNQSLAYPTLENQTIELKKRYLILSLLELIT